MYIPTYYVTNSLEREIGRVYDVQYVFFQLVGTTYYIKEHKDE